MRAPATVTELQAMAGQALRDQDFETLAMLRETNEGWVQTDSEREALGSMLTAMQEAIEDAGSPGDRLEPASIALENLVHTLATLTTSRADREELRGALCCALSVAERIRDDLQELAR